MTSHSILWQDRFGNLAHRSPLTAGAVLDFQKGFALGEVVAQLGSVPHGG